MKKITRARITFSLITIIIVSFIVSFMTFNRTVQASASSFSKKWFLGGYHNCIISLASDNIPTTGGGSFVDDKTLEEFIFPEKGDGLPHPSQDYLNLGSSDITCTDVLDGNNTGEYEGIFKQIGLVPKTPMSEMSSKSGEIKRLGYESVGDTNRINFITGATSNVNNKLFTDHEETRSPFLIVTPDSGGAKFALYDGDDDNLNLELNGTELRVKWQPKLPSINCWFSDIIRDNNLRDIPIDLSRLYNANGSYTVVTNADEANEAINRQLNTVEANYMCHQLATGATIVQFITANITDPDVATSNFGAYSITDYIRSKTVTSSGYSLGDRPEAAKRAIESLAGKSDNPEGDPLKNIRLEDDEQYEYYYWALQKAVSNWGDDPLGNGALTCTQSKDTDLEIHLKSKDNSWHKYYLRSLDFNLEFITMEVSGNNVTFPKKSLKDIIDWMNGHRVDESDTSCPAPAGAEELKEEADKDACWKNSGELSWIICPIMKYAGGAVSGLYKSIIEPLLQIDANAFKTDGPAYSGWQVFQSIANIVFVILFLVVILSQLTGVGIDNLGIKRIMPKLIITAVLVNVSYIICMALVDVSNIVGYGLYGFFDNLDAGAGISSVEASAITNFVAGTGVAAGITASAVGVAAIALNPSLILPLLLGLLGLLISVLFMFVLLGVYQAGVVIAVVVSPIAFVLYMLPNTKNIFDRWRKIFQSLLLLYPICGLVMGGGAFAGRIISNSSPEFFVRLTGALLAVVPFFFIPKILQSSLSAMGNIGAKISGLGKAASGKATGAIANSQAVKDWQTRGKAGYRLSGKRTIGGRIREGFGKNDTISKIPVLRSMQKSSNRKMSRAEASYQKMVDEQVMKPETIRNAAEAERYRKDVSAFDSYLVKEGIADKIGAMNADGEFEEGSLAYELEHATEEYQRAAITSRLMSTKPGQEALYQVVNKMSKKGGDTNAVKQIARTAKNDKKFGDLKDKNLSMADYFNNLGRNGLATGAQFKEGESLNDFIGNTDFGNLKPEDVTKLSAKELNRYVRAIENGSFSEEKANQLKGIVQQTVDSEMLRDKIGDDAGKEMRSILSAGYGSAKNGRATATGSGSTGSKTSGASGGSVNSGNAVEGESFQVNSEKPANKTTSSEK